MPSRIAKRKSLPGRQAAAARAVLRASPADAGEAERLSGLPPWARTRIAELEAQLDELRARMQRAHQALTLRTGEDPEPAQVG